MLETGCSPLRWSMKRPAGERQLPARPLLQAAAFWCGDGTLLVLRGGPGQLSALQPSWCAVADMLDFHPCRYDGQVFVKPPEVLARDRLLGTYEVRPVLARLR